MTKERKPTGQDEPNYNNKANNTGINIDNQDTWLHISIALSQAMAGLTPEQKAKQEESNIAFVFQVLLQPHRRSLKKVILIKLYEYGVLDLYQTSYLFNIFNLKEV
jgi:hypothetical protein